MNQPKIYSRTGKLPHSKFDLSAIRKLTVCDFSPNTIYYYQLYDKLNNSVSFNSCLDESHWTHFKNDPTTKFLYENLNETFDQRFVNELAIVIALRELPVDRVYVIVVDLLHQQFLEQGLAKLGITGIHIAISWQSVVLTDIPQHNIPTNHKFSCLSRNYRPWRLRFFAELVNKDLIKDFVYTFHNIFPYGNVKTFPLLQLRKDLKFWDIDATPEPLNTWIEGIPYNLDARVDLKFHMATYIAIQQADINIIIESKFNPNEYRIGRAYDPNFQPVFLTEKTFKAIACARPFIMYSVPGSLDAIRSLGFKTYQNIINEDYDTMFNNEQRHTAVIAELERIANLDDTAYAEFIDQCNIIAQHNLQVFKQLKDNSMWTKDKYPKFAWLNQFKESTQL